MLNRAEQSHLRVGAILDKVQTLSGLSEEELRSAVTTKAQAALDRLQALGLAYPIPIGGDIKPDAVGVAGRTYRAKVWSAGTGFKKGVIGFNVLTSIAIESDGKLWFHASLTRYDGKMPTYSDLCWLREHFFAGRWAVQYFPPETEHVSDHNACLHLWTCLEAFEMPDFRKFGTV